MGEIAGTVEKALQAEGLVSARVDFPQNIFRDEPGYRRELRQAIARVAPDVILPVGHPLALSRMRDDLAAMGIRAIVEREALIRQLDGKVSFSALASRLGIPQPRIYASPQEVEDAYGVVFKRDVSFGGHGVHQPRNMNSLLNLIAHQKPGEPYLIEDYIEGEDWSVDALRLGGEFRFSAYRSVASQGKGPSTRREMVEAPQLGEYASRIMEHLGYEGVCGFDFRVDAEGRAFILEANPRFTAGLESQLDAGFNIPALLVKGKIS